MRAPWSWFGGTRFRHEQDPNQPPEQGFEGFAEHMQAQEWERKADITLGCEPDFPGDDR